VRSEYQTNGSLCPKTLQKRPTTIGPSPWLNELLVEGLSGAGKSSVYDELIRRGYKAISTDRAWTYHADPDTGLPDGRSSSRHFMWDQQKAVSELEKPGTRSVICL
jgi:hypothetical protein